MHVCTVEQPRSHFLSCNHSPLHPPHTPVSHAASKGFLLAIVFRMTPAFFLPHVCNAPSTSKNCSLNVASKDYVNRNYKSLQTTLSPGNLYSLPFCPSIPQHGVGARVEERVELFELRARGLSAEDGK